MTDLLNRARALIRGLTLRERWLAVFASCVVLALAVHSFWVVPLQERADALERQIDAEQTNLLRTIRLTGDVRRLQGPLGLVEKQIIPGQKTDLLTLLETLGREAGLDGDQIESVKPKPPSKNERYPETRVEVRLKGTTLKQIVRLLHAIESARLYLIVRSLRITTRGKDEQLLDVSFSVSSYERT